MNEEYGIELKLLTNKFKVQMNSIATSVKNWANKTKQDASVIPDVNITNSVIRIRELEREINTLKKEMADTEVGSKAFNNYAIAIDNATKELNELQAGLNQVNKTSKNLDLEKNLNKATNSGKKFILSLFSLRSIWSLISRASSSYIQTNDVLNNKIQLTSHIFGNMLAPAIKKVVDYSQYAGIILAKVIQLFTGYNALANITTKSLNGTSKASRNLSKSLASFDTITNLGDKTSGVSSDIASSVNALNDFQEKIQKVEEIFSKYEDEIKLATIALLGMIGVGMLSKLAKFIGVSSVTKPTGLLGIKTILGLLGKAVVITIVAYSIYEAIEAWKEYKEVMKGVDKARDAMIKKNEEMDEAINNSVKKIDELAKANKNTSNEVKKLTADVVQQTTDLKVNQEGVMGTQTMWERLSGTLSEKTKKSLENISNSLWNSTEALKQQYEQGRLNKEGQEAYKNSLESAINTLGEQNTYLDSNSEQYKTNKKRIDDLYDSLTQVAGEDYVIKIKADTKSASMSLSNFWSKLGASFSTITDWRSWKSGIGSKLKSIWSGASYDVGTNYVPNDQLAMVHKGEQIIPAKWNPATSGIYNNNDEVVRKLDKLITTLENKKFSASISSNDIGKASTNYIKEQSRIMGRSVIQ